MTSFIFGTKHEEITLSVPKQNYYLDITHGNSNRMGLIFINDQSRYTLKLIVVLQTPATKMIQTR